MENLRKEHELIDIFYNLTSIPSPSLREEKVVEWVKDFCCKEGLNCKTDNYNNVIIKLDATDTSKPILALSSHMDVVGDDSPVIPTLDGDFIHANGRTLGGDDKFGMSAALKLLKDIKNSNLNHGGLEVVFTRDEENGMSGIHNFDFNNLNSKYVLFVMRMNLEYYKFQAQVIVMDMWKYLAKVGTLVLKLQIKQNQMLQN